MSYPLSNISLNVSQITSSNTSQKAEHSNQITIYESDKENIKPSLSQSQVTNEVQVTKEETNPFETIFQSSQLTHLNFTGETLLKLLNIVETYNRYIGLYVQINEIDLDQLIDSLNKDNDYYKFILKTLIQIILNELFNDCTIFNVNINDFNLIQDDSCLNEVCLLVCKLINDSANISKDKSNIVLSKSDMNASSLTIENKIDLIHLFIEAIIIDGKTYRSNLIFLNNEIGNIEIKMSQIKHELSSLQSRQFYLQNPTDIEAYHKQKTEFKELEVKLVNKWRALKNYSRLNQIGRIKFNKFCFLYIWRFQVFSNSLIVERRFVDDSTSEWYKIDSIETMTQILCYMKQSSSNIAETVRQFEEVLDDIKSNKEIEVNDFKFCNKIEIKIESNDAIVSSILDSRDILTELELLVENLIYANFVQIDLKFKRDYSLQQYNMNRFLGSIQWLNHPTDLKSLKDTLIDLFHSINKRYLNTKFANESNELWQKWCVMCRSENELKLALFFLIKNIKWNLSSSEETCQICFKKDDNKFKSSELTNTFKNKCNRCHKFYHLKCVVESKEFNLFKSDAYHLLCKQCFEEETLKELEEYNKLEQKREEDSKLDTFQVNSRTLRMNARAKRLLNGDELDESVESPVKKSSKRKRVFIESDESSSDSDSPRSRVFNKQHSERLKKSLRPRTRISYNYDDENNDLD